MILLRVLGLAVLAGLVGLVARYWRESIVSDGVYSAQAYDTATTMLHICWVLGGLALAFVGLHLLVTPRHDAAT